MFLVSFSQTFMFNSRPGDNLQFNVKYLHPYYEKMGNSSSSLSSNIFSLGANIPISGKLNLLMDFNLSHFSVERNINNYPNYQYDDISETALGNIYVGLQIAKSRNNPSAVNMEVGVYIPAASGKNSGVLIYSSVSDYYYAPKYVPNAFSFNFILSKWNTVTENFEWGFEAGPVIMIPTKGETSETEVFLRYGFGPNFYISDFIFMTEFNGICILTQETEDFTDKFINTLGFGAGYRFGNITPKIFYKIELSNLIKYLSSGALGIKLEMAL
jgi:hypothetical protein